MASVTFDVQLAIQGETSIRGTPAIRRGAAGKPADNARREEVPEPVRRGPEGQPLARLAKRVGHCGGLDGSDRHQDRRTGPRLGVEPVLLRWPVTQLVKRTALMRELQAPYPGCAHRTYRRLPGVQSAP